MKNLLFYRGTGFQPVKCIPNMILRFGSLKTWPGWPCHTQMLRLRLSMTKHAGLKKTLCAYVPVLLCTYVPMRLQVSSTKDYVRNFQQKMQNEANFFVLRGAYCVLRKRIQAL